MASDRKYITIPLSPETHAALMEMATYRGMRPGSLAEIALQEWLATATENMSDTRVTIPMMLSGLERDRKMRESAMEMAKHIAYQVADGHPQSPKLADQLTKLCDYLGVSVDKLLEDTETDYLKPARLLNSERNKSALVEIMTEHVQLPTTDIERLWRERGLAPSALDRTKRALATEGFNIVAERHAEKWWWKVDMEETTSS